MFVCMPTFQVQTVRTIVSLLSSTELLCCDTTSLRTLLTIPAGMHSILTLSLDVIH